MSRESLFDLISVSVSAIIVVGAMLLIFSDADSAGLHASSRSVEDVYTQVGEKLAETGSVLHVKTDTETTGPFAYKSTGEQWIDIANQQVREQTAYENAGSIDALITLKEYYQRAGTAPATVSSSESRICYGAGVTVSALLGCAAPSTASEKRVEEGKVNGRNVVVLIESGKQTSEGRTLTFTHRLYLDASTLMPVEAAAEGEWDLGNGTTEPYSATTTYEIETMQISALAVGFFLPSAIGFTQQDAEAGIRGAGDLQVYWLGERWEMPGVGSFVLRSSFALPDRGRPFKYSLTYARADAPLDPPFLNLQIYFLDMWQANPADPLEASFLGDVVVYFAEIQSEGQDGPVADAAGLRCPEGQPRPVRADGGRCPAAAGSNR